MLRSAPFCDITQRLVLIAYERFGTTDFSTLVDETDRFYRSVGRKLPKHGA